MRPAVLALALLAAGCLDRSSGSVNKSDAHGSDVKTATDTVAQQPKDTVTPKDTHITEDPVFSELPDAWVEAPAGFCEELSHQSIATYNHDGDTIGIVTGDKVRFIGIDSTEVNSNDCYSAEGTQALRALLEPNKTVCLYPDPGGQDKDVYGRLLRHVFILHDGKWVLANLRMVRLGAARAYHSFLKGTKYKTQTEEAELLARDESRGGWGSCGWLIK